jgi:hypothetical protein
MVSASARTKDYDKSKYISILNIIQVGRGGRRGGVWGGEWKGWRAGASHPTH